MDAAGFLRRKSNTSGLYSEEEPLVDSNTVEPPEDQGKPVNGKANGTVNGAIKSETIDDGEAILGGPLVRDEFQNERGIKVHIDRSRDELLTAFGKATLEDRYLMTGESFQDLFARVAAHFADDTAHAQRLYDYISKLWFMPATPVLSNGGTSRGLPISCYLNSVEDSLDGIVGTWNENVWLASKGGGIGTYWGDVRGIGEPVGLNGKTSGIIPFVRVMDSLTLAISQGSLRRGSAACYLDISHPEIEEFLEIRKPSGDFNRKALAWRDQVLWPHPELKPRRVVDVFAEERASLLPLPAKAMAVELLKPVRSQKPIYIRFDLNDYSIPPGAVGKKLVLAASDQRVEIRRRILSAGADHVVLRTDRDWVADLVRHISGRRRGRTTGRRP